MSILKFEHYNQALDMSAHFQKNFNNEVVLESNESKKIFKTLSKFIRP